MVARRHELLKLSVDNVTDYLKVVQFRLPFRLHDIRRVEEVGEYSNTNWIFRLTVETKRKQTKYYLKQSQRYDHRGTTKGRPLELPLGRTVGEVDLLRKLAKLWGRGAVPRVYFFDTKHHACLLSDAAVNGRLLIEEFSQDRVHPEIGRTLGVYLAKLHVSTYKLRTQPSSSSAWRNIIIGFFDSHWSIGIRKHVPSNAVDKFYQDVRRAPSAIVWGDPVHRNIFVKPKGKVSMVDFDFTVRYDPMLDLGVLVAHWVWMWVKGERRMALDCERFMNECSQAYWSYWRRHADLSISEQDAMQLRLLRWIGLYLVSRTDGRSGSYFEEWPGWEKRVRQLGVELFMMQPTQQARKLVSLLSI